MITKCLIHTGVVTDSYTFTSKHYIHPRWTGAVPEYSPRDNDNSVPGCNTRFSTDGDKEAKLTDYSL